MCVYAFVFVYVCLLCIWVRDCVRYIPNVLTTPFGKKEWNIPTKLHMPCPSESIEFYNLPILAKDHLPIKNQRTLADEETSSFSSSTPPHSLLLLLLLLVVSIPLPEQLFLSTNNNSNNIFRFFGFIILFAFYVYHWRRDDLWHSTDEFITTRITCPVYKISHRKIFAWPTQSWWWCRWEQRFWYFFQGCCKVVFSQYMYQIIWVCFVAINDCL